MFKTDLEYHWDQLIQFKVTSKWASRYNLGSLKLILEFYEDSRELEVIRKSSKRNEPLRSKRFLFH